VTPCLITIKQRVKVSKFSLPPNIIT
jgi:hypothetical protein